ncbi:CPBP family intramembrane glutamic endopeptidase [Cellvibrio japonicus]|uniref:CAAX amino terminal protease family protein n=1 Tax=Cellvibrio japonicus (strain Ueda107) TaxID=498211 RepID=B3PF31_CELJU|nr:CPBP family intramembrane glutamic endopeptidase [Cellvibrio japonicus]ACE82669.1 CAAX amino terminal protease family protein [Cellvibrio japonicus Ueda107]
MLLLVAAVYRYRPMPVWQRVLCWLAMVPLAFWAATHRPEDFSYPLLLQLTNTDGAVTFSLYANLAKGLVGILLLALLWPARREVDFRAPVSLRWLVLLASPLLIVGVAAPLLGLQWQPKLIEQIAIFAWANLLLTCVAEEAFLRLLLQLPMIRVLQAWTQHRWLQEALPLLLVTVIFVLIHSGLSGAAIWVYGLAGFLYGLSYTLSKNVFFPIAVHCAVNLLHFSLLSYPGN